MEHQSMDPPDGEGGDVAAETSDVKIRMTVPGVLHPATTYALSPDDENEIRELDILAFSKNGSGVDTFCYRITVDPAKIKPGAGEVNGNLKDADVKLQRYKNPLKLVVVANASTVLDGAAIATGETLGDVYNRLKFNFSGKWQTNPYAPFPMWGESDDPEYVLVQDPVVMERVEVTLVRSIAKIDVGVDLFAVDPSLGFGNHFKIKHIYVYNPRNRGFLAPSLPNFDRTLHKATAPSVPTDATPITATQEYIIGTNKFFSEIYVPEAAVAPNPTFLVIGAEYDNGPELYYRVDFIDASDNTLPLLRNHRYLINIRNISRPGFATKEEAAAIRSANLEYDLSVTDARMKEFVFDGQYYLALSEGDMVMTETDAKQIYVETNYPGVPAWTVSYNGSFFLSQTTTPSYTGFSVNKLYDAYVREGAITFRAGTLTKTIHVRQYASFTSSATAANLIIDRATAGMDGTIRAGATIDLLWEDVPNIVSSTYPSANPAGVTLNGAGNAVFVLRDGSSNIVWSWHVWNGYDPDSPAGQVNYKGRIFMDRNLGAKAYAPGSVDSYGLLYQWGRKEPLVGSQSLTGSTQRSTYRGSAVPLPYVSPQDVTTLGSNPLEESHRRPATFITSTLPPWYTWSDTDDADNSLWTTGGLKSPYDPCPAGWRVPTAAEFLEALTPVGGWNYGQAYEGGLVLPAAGGLDFSTGQLFDVGASGYYWTAETAGPSAKCLHIRNGSATIENAFRANGFSVRCMKEKYNE
jgi:hypothetical protein